MSELAPDELAQSRTLDPGTEVEVRDGFEGHWHGGYVIDAVEDGGSRYRVGRTSDGSVLPQPLPRSSIRRQRRTSMWWI